MDAHTRDSMLFYLDPTPPSVIGDIAELGKILVDSSVSLWDRYRAMFSLRNIGGKEAVVSLAQGTAGILQQC